MKLKGFLLLAAFLLSRSTLFAGCENQVSSISFEEREARQLATKWGFGSSLSFLEIAGRCLSLRQQIREVVRFFADSACYLRADLPQESFQISLHDIAAQTTSYFEPPPKNLKEVIADQNATLESILHAPKQQALVIAILGNNKPQRSVSDTFIPVACIDIALRYLLCAPRRCQLVLHFYL